MRRFPSLRPIPPPHASRRVALVACLLVGSSAALAIAAAGASGSGVSRSRPKPLWSTINVCDTPPSSHRFGVRGQAPGDGTRERIYMRFTAQFRTRGHWRPVAGRGISAWLDAGSALFREQQTGYTFKLAPPTPGAAYLLRGRVDFEWRRGRRVVRRAHALTQAGHPHTRGADPAAYSAATCHMRAPTAGAGK